MEVTLRKSLLQYRQVRDYTKSLCDPLSAEDMVPQAVGFVSPIKWHLAHTTWFFEQFILKPNVRSYRSFDDRFEYLFNSYYNTLGERIDRAERGLITRPSLDRVWAYRSYVDERMQELLEGHYDEAVHTLLAIGLQHEQQHQELILMDIKYTLSRNPSHPLYHPDRNLVDDAAGPAGWLSLEAGLYEVGASNEGFHFDNEFARHQVYLNSFELSTSLVRNEEYLEFIDDGGYKEHRWWHDEAWAWVQQNKLSHPLYWRKLDHEWHQFTLAGLQALNPDAALAHVSHYEAFAFASWKGMRLPTEFEWEAAADQFKWGTRWEHTSSAYMPYPGYKRPDGAVGEYNGKFMINQMVLRGACNATPDGHSRITYRNFFHPDMRWHFSGIRLAKDQDD